MNTKQRTSHKKTPYGPNNVRAWFDTVFLYSLRGLENERQFLVRRNWTFRFRHRSLEYLRPLVEHLPGEVPEILDQFTRFFPDVAGQIKEHDERSRELEQSCDTYFVALLNNPGFKNAFQAVAEEVPKELGKDFSSYFGAYSSEADFQGLLAELLVNNVESEPSHYSTAEIWNRYRDRFFKTLSAPELSTLNERTTECGQAMLKAVNDLASSLKQTRSDLSLEFDVPYFARPNSAG